MSSRMDDVVHVQWMIGFIGLFNFVHISLLSVVSLIVIKITFNFKTMGEAG